MCIYIHIYIIYIRTSLPKRAWSGGRLKKKREEPSSREAKERGRVIGPRGRFFVRCCCCCFFSFARGRDRERWKLYAAVLFRYDRRGPLYTRARSLARSLLIDGSREYLFFLLLLLFAGRARELADQMPLGVLARPARGSRRPNEKKRIRRSSGARRPRRSLSLSLSLYPSFFFYLQSGCARSLVAYAKENKRERASWLQPAH